MGLHLQDAPKSHGDVLSRVGSADTTVSVTKFHSFVLVHASTTRTLAGVHVTYSVAVESAGLSNVGPTGTVTLSDNGVALAGCTNLILSAQSTVSCTVSERTGPNDQITAFYSGDSTYLASSETLSDSLSRIRTPGVL